MRPLPMCNDQCMSLRFIAPFLSSNNARSEAFLLVCEMVPGVLAGELKTVSPTMVSKMKWNAWCVRPRFCTYKALLSRRQPGLRWILLCTIPLVQDRSFDLLTSSPVRYQCTKDTPYYGIRNHMMNWQAFYTITTNFLHYWVGALTSWNYICIYQNTIDCF